jgi:hypothetical protein
VKDWSIIVPMIPRIQESLRWWKDPRNIMPGIALRPPVPQIHLYTDASGVGWGGHFEEGDLTASGVFSPMEARLHINQKELLAILYTLQELVIHVSGLAVLVNTDNKTVEAYVNKQGGTRSVQMLLRTKQLYQWLDQHNIYLTATHIAGARNVIADQLSRPNQLIHGEWTLHPQVFRTVCKQWGTPQIDLFATKWTNRLPLYISPLPDPAAIGVDALSLPWPTSFGYAFPPFIIIQKVLNKLKDEKCQILLIAPNWENSSWFPDLLEMLIAPPRPLPFHRQLLKQPQRNIFHLNPAGPNLHMWLLSSLAHEAEAFRQSLQDELPWPTEDQPYGIIPTYGASSWIGACHGKQIHSEPIVL